ncbi:hypothetical protein [Streptomyces sp. NPDC002619]|uniref:hypothetical protein n=1 Tax=Streptomyces sp. NPDC002619 TaxID=3364655 RepID=UPI0036904D8D
MRGHPHRPPGNVVFTFVAASCAFFPQHFADIPGHLALTLAAGLLAWMVCMAPGLVRSQEPQRLAVARALNAAVQLARTPNDGPAHAPASRAAALAAAQAWRTVSLIRAHHPERRALALPLARAEAGSADPGSWPAGRDSCAGPRRCPISFHPAREPIRSPALAPHRARPGADRAAAGR